MHACNQQVHKYHNLLSKGFTPHYYYFKCSFFNWKIWLKNTPIVIMFNMIKVSFWTSWSRLDHLDWVFFISFLTRFLTNQQCFDNDYTYDFKYFSNINYNIYNNNKLINIIFNYLDGLPINIKIDNSKIIYLPTYSI